MKILTQNEIVGSRILRVYQFDLAFDTERDFQPRLIIVELDSGAVFALQQEQIIIPGVNEAAKIVGANIKTGATILIQKETCKELDSPIRVFFFLTVGSGL